MYEFYSLQKCDGQAGPLLGKVIALAGPLLGEVIDCDKPGPREASASKNGASGSA